MFFKLALLLLILTTRLSLSISQRHDCTCTAQDHDKGGCLAITQVTATVKSFVCPEEDCLNLYFETKVWGTDIYTTDSGLCFAAIHAGAIPRSTTGLSDAQRTVYFEDKETRNGFTGTLRKGVKTRDHGYSDHAFRFIREGCGNGYYGQNCHETKCGTCLDNVDCHRFTGICTKGCSPGYQPDSYCNKACSDQTFGDKCSNKCLCTDKTACDHIEGPLPTCKCIEGYWGAPHCKPNSPVRIEQLSTESTKQRGLTNVKCIASGGPPPDVLHFVITVNRVETEIDLEFENETVTEVESKVPGLKPSDRVNCKAKNDAGYTDERTKEIDMFGILIDIDSVTDEPEASGLSGAAEGGIGSIAGALVLIVAIVACVCYCRRNRRSQPPPAAAPVVIFNVPGNRNKEGNKENLYDAIHTNS